MKKKYPKTGRKIFLLFLMVGLSLLCKATTYYVSNSGNDSNPGTTTALPWQTLNKVNISTFLPGDQILFQRGSTFYGSLIINQSGNSNAPIIYGAYGTGANPLISGFNNVNTWTNLGNNIWESTNAVSTLSTCNMVVIDGINTPMGKFPNEGTTHMGYIFFQSHTNFSITSNSLSGTPNWTGAELFILKEQFSFSRRIITSQTGNTVSWRDSLKLTNDGMPFFIQNHINTLDQQNEWYYNPTTKKISIYSISQPMNVRVAAIDKLVTIGKAVKYIVLNSIDFTGANTNAIYRWPFGLPEERVQYITVKNCNIFFSGEDAIAARIDHLNIEDNSISNSNGHGIQVDYSKYVVIKNNAISNTGVYKGMAPGLGAVCALKVSNVVNALVEYNKITHSGYNGITFSDVGTDSMTIQYNYVDTFCTVLSDGGGIYGNRNARILNNILLNGGAGMIKLWIYDPWAVGIYLDDNSFNNEVSGNTVANNNRVGIYLHNSRRNNVHDNLSYNNATWQLYTNDDNFPGWNANNVIAHNKFISKIANYQTVNYYYGNGADTTLGIMHDNYYCRPANEGAEIHTTNQHNYTIAQWQSLTGNDFNSHGSAQFINNENDLHFYYNETKTVKIITLTQPMMNVKGIRYSGSIALQPFTSEVLMKGKNQTRK